MYFKKLFLVPLFLISFSIYLFPQDNGDSTENNEKNSWPNWKKEFNIFHGGFHGQPTITFLYGFSSMNQKDILRNYANPNLLELKIGYTKERLNHEDENIINYNYHYLQLSYFSTDPANTPDNPDVQSKMWRLGFGSASGYGYNFGNSALIPYYSSGFMWSRVEILPDRVMTFAALPPSGLEDFDQAIRFGTSAEGGIRLNIAEHYTLEAGYERSIIFRRHLFGKWVVSGIIESISQSAVDKFVDEVLYSSPKAAPIVNFVLKNALAYGYYELCQSKMNWPFNTEPPLAYNQFKFGITFIF
jgi:hypothetical protein